MFDDGKFRTLFDGVLFLGKDTDQGAGKGSRYFGIYLVCGDLQQRLTFGDRVAWLLEPARKGSHRSALSDGWQCERRCCSRVRHWITSRVARTMLSTSIPW